MQYPHHKLKTHYSWFVKMQYPHDKFKNLLPMVGEMQHPYDKLKNPLFMGVKYAIHLTLWP